MSGHSKWANIKHRKGKQDAKRGKMFTRFGKEITIAARDGGGDIDGNPRLRLAVQNARAYNMPGENITRAIKRGTGELEGITYEELTYEGYAPCGVAVILETITDNKNRTVAEIRSWFGKYGGNMGDNGAVAWNFNRKGTVTIKTEGKTEDELLEHVLESGGEDLEYDEDTSRIICAMENFGIVNKYFTDKGFNFEESKLSYIASNTVKITNIEDARKVMRFIDNMEEQEDVQNLYSNVEFDDAVEELLEKE